jgi:hypothetical protein
MSFIKTILKRFQKKKSGCKKGLRIVDIEKKLENNNRKIKYALDKREWNWKLIQENLVLRERLSGEQYIGGRP